MNHSLVERAEWRNREGATADLSRIYADQVAYVWRSLRYLGVAESDIEDVCHEVFVVVGRKLEGFEGRSSLRTWIYGICLRTASDYRGRAHRRREVVTDEPPDTTRAPNQFRESSRRQLRERLQSLLDELRPEQREVFVLYEIEQLQMQEVAEAVGCPLQTAYSRLHAARRALKKRLAQEGHVP